MYRRPLSYSKLPSDVEQGYIDTKIQQRKNHYHSVSQMQKAKRIWIATRKQRDPIQ